MQEPAHEIKMKIGPVLATEYRQITPASLLASHVFLKSMITRGCRNCVLELKKVQYALRKYLTKEENKPFLGSWDLEECVEKVGCHWQQCMGMLRHLVKEEDGEGMPNRRFPRSGGFRKNVKSHEWTLIWELMQEADDVYDPEPEKNREKKPETPSRLPLTPSKLDIDGLDARGFPTCFVKTPVVATVVAEHACEDDLDSAIAAESASEDGDGIPTVFALSKKPAANLDDLLTMLPAQVGGRKKEIKKNKKEKTKANAQADATAIIQKSYLSITSEKNPRAELTARADGLRIFIHTWTLRKHGPRYAQQAKAFQAWLDSGKKCKADAIARLAGLSG